MANWLGRHSAAQIDYLKAENRAAVSQKWTALGPGVPDPPLTNLEHPRPNSRHRRGESYAVRVNPILGGLHQEYFLAPAYT